MKTFKTNISDLIFFQPNVYSDKRGHFFEAYHDEIVYSYVKHHFVQDNQSHSKYGVLRGLHYQAGANVQAKLVRVLQGEIMDVVVDLRTYSKTYGQTYSIVLNDINKYQLYVPKGFAHGFVTLSKTADILYKCDSYFNKGSEGGIIYDDPTLGIDWGIPKEDMIISNKDKELPKFGDHLKFDKIPSNGLILQMDFPKFNFGKYRGLWINDILVNDMNYCNWVVNNLRNSREAIYIMKSRYYLQQKKKLAVTI